MSCIKNFPCAVVALWLRRKIIFLKAIEGTITMTCILPLLNFIFVIWHTAESSKTNGKMNSNFIHQYFFHFQRHKWGKFLLWDCLANIPAGIYLIYKHMHRNIFLTTQIEENTQILLAFSSHVWPEIETHPQYFQVNWYGSFWIESGLLDLFSAKYSRWTISRKVKGVWFHGCKGTWCYLFPLSSLFQHECIAIGTTFALKPISLACFWSHLCHTDYINEA